VIASNSVPRLLDASGALAHRFLFVPFEMSFVGREDIHLEEKLLRELPGIANWALAGLKTLRAANGRFTLGDGHKRLASQYAADTSPIMAWVRSEMAVHRRADPGDLPPECLTSASVSIGKTEAYDRYVLWCEAHDIEPTRPAWFGRGLKTLIPKLQEGRDTKADGSRAMIYRGIGVRNSTTPDVAQPKKSDCTTDNNHAPAPNSVGVLSLSGQSGHLDCFVQLFDKKDEGIGREKVVENKENALTALTEPPSNDSEGEKRDSLREARRISQNLRQQYRNGYVVQPDVKDLSVWRVGKEVGGTTRWLEQAGTREWAVEEVRRRTTPQPVPSPIPDEDDEDHTADVLNTLVCNIDEGMFDLSNSDDRDDLECQIASGLDHPDVGDMAESLLLDLDNGHVNLEDVRERVDEMLAVLMQAEEEMTEDEAWAWLDENMVATG